MAPLLIIKTRMSLLFYGDDMKDMNLRTRMLIGDDKLNKIINSKILVFGVGGVGSYVVEALARAGVGNIGIVDNEEIDDYNILNATYMAMKKALNSMKKQPDYLLVDAVTIPGVDIKQNPIIKGDSKSISIAAASILAKVTRDRMMCEYDEIYPEYGFKSNKGYGTKEHYEAIEKLGITPIHRKSFLKNVL